LFGIVEGQLSVGPALPDSTEGWLAMNIEPHDVPSDMPQAYYDALPQMIKEYQKVNNSDRDHNYFLQMYLGDFRAIYKVDEDMEHAAKTPYTVSNYLSAAWPDFIRYQISSFSPTPFFLAIGNHETVLRNRGDFVSQFGDWLTRPEIVQQRLADDPNDHAIKAYYHELPNDYTHDAARETKFGFTFAPKGFLNRN